MAVVRASPKLLLPSKLPPSCPRGTPKVNQAKWARSFRQVGRRTDRTTYRVRLTLWLKSWILTQLKKAFRNDYISKGPGSKRLLQGVLQQLWHSFSPSCTIFKAFQRGHFEYVTQIKIFIWGMGRYEIYTNRAAQHGKGGAFLPSKKNWAHPPRMHLLFLTIFTKTNFWQVHAAFQLVGVRAVD